MFHNSFKFFDTSDGINLDSNLDHLNPEELLDDLGRTEPPGIENQEKELKFDDDIDNILKVAFEVKDADSFVKQSTPIIESTNSSGFISDEPEMVNSSDHSPISVGNDEIQPPEAVQLHPPPPPPKLPYLQHPLPPIPESPAPSQMHVEQVPLTPYSSQLERPSPAPTPIQTLTIPNYNTTINIKDIDPTKPLKIHDPIELKKLIEKKIIKVKVDPATGTKYHELNVEELKKQQRLQKNRMSASESRKRQKDYIKLLEEKVFYLEHENRILKEKVLVLEKYQGVMNVESSEIVTQTPTGQITQTPTEQKISQINSQIDYNKPRMVKRKSVNESSEQFLRVLSKLHSFLSFPSLFPSFSNFPPPFALLSGKGGVKDGERRGKGGGKEGKRRGKGGEKEGESSETALLNRQMFQASHNFHIPSKIQKFGNFTIFAVAACLSCLFLINLDVSHESILNRSKDDVMFASKNLFSTDFQHDLDQPFTHKSSASGNWIDLLNQPIILNQLNQKIQNGEICQHLQSNKTLKKFRVFQNSNVREESLTIRKDFNHFRNIYNNQTGFNSGSSGLTTSATSRKPQSTKPQNSFQNFKKEQERKKLNTAMSKLLSQYSKSNNPKMNETIYFFSNLNSKSTDIKNGQHLSIPIGNLAQDLTLSKQPKMSIFVSAPFEGETIIFNNNYLIKDTVLMRIDCDITKTEYIGYGSDPEDFSGVVDDGKGHLGFEV